MRPSWTLEADLQDLAVVADEPSRFRIRKSDRPVAAHLRQIEPGLSFIGSPGGCAGSEVWLSLGRDHDGPLVLMAEAVPVIPIIAVFAATHIGETEDRSWNGRLLGERPGLAAIV